MYCTWVLTSKPIEHGLICKWSESPQFVWGTTDFVIAPNSTPKYLQFPPSWQLVFWNGNATLKPGGNTSPPSTFYGLALPYDLLAKSQFWGATWKTKLSLEMQCRFELVILSVTCKSQTFTRLDSKLDKAGNCRQSGRSGLILPCTFTFLFCYIQVHTVRS